MDIGPPPPPPFSFETTPSSTATTTDTVIPQVYYNGGPATTYGESNYHRSSSPATSATIIIIIISSAVIISGTICLLIRFFSRRNPNSFSRSDDVVSDNRNVNEHVRHHVISIGNNVPDSLPLFTFSSVTGKTSTGDCAVCLSKFEGADQLRLLPFCCHAFHAQCIDSWLKSNQTCPLCRSPVNPTEADVMNKIASGGGAGVVGDQSNSFRIEIGTVSQRRDPSETDRRSYSVGSFEYVVDDGYEIPVESTHQRAVSDCTSVDKDIVTETPVQNLAAEVAGGESGRRNWLRDYVDRISVSLSSRSLSFRGSGRFFTGSSRRSDTVDDFEETHSRMGEEISELFRWLSGV